MLISPVSLARTQYKASFREHNKNIHKQEEANPISKKGESAKLVLATFIGGLGAAARLFWELVIDGDFEFDRVARKASKLVEENKSHLSETKKELCKIGAFASLIAAAFAGFALLYTAFLAPKIAYESEVKAFEKSKEMDVYTKANKAEKEIYTQLADKAQNATKEEKDNLKEQYTKMKIAKNQVPDFVKL